MQLGMQSLPFFFKEKSGRLTSPNKRVIPCQVWCDLGRCWFISPWLLSIQVGDSDSDNMQEDIGSDEVSGRLLALILTPLAYLVISS